MEWPGQYPAPTRVVPPVIFGQTLLLYGLSLMEHTYETLDRNKLRPM